jgi:hypothetical protein
MNLRDAFGRHKYCVTSRVEAEFVLARRMSTPHQSCVDGEIVKMKVVRLTCGMSSFMRRMGFKCAKWYPAGDLCRPQALEN